MAHALTGPDRRSALNRRLNRFRTSDGRFFILALDHCLSIGPLPGLDDVQEWADFAERHHIPGIVLNPGTAGRCAVASTVGLVVQLVGLPVWSSARKAKVPLASVLRAVELGADAISIQLLFGDYPDFSNSIAACTELVQNALSLRIPVLCMVSFASEETPTEDLRRGVIACSELGCTLIKAPLPDDLSDDAAARLRGTLQYTPPLLLAGGPPSNSFLDDAKRALDVGYSGLCIGRNLIQSPAPSELAADLVRLLSD